MKFLQLAALFVACHATTAQSKNILDLAKDPANGLDTLATALDASGLAYKFVEKWWCARWPSFCHKYTVFAPTNDAFAALPNGTLDRLLDEEFHPHLKDLLKYHVVDGEIMSSGITDGAKVETLNQEDITASVGEDGSITLNADATVVKKDIDASNGVVHVVDQVLLPQSATSNIADIATNAEFTTLVSLLGKVNLVGFVSDSSNVLTVFAPTDEAFAKFLADTGFDVDDLDAVEELLKYHVVQGEVKTNYELSEGRDIETVQGSTISVDRKKWWSKEFNLNGNVDVIQVDILASNGIIHVIDSVLTLPSPLEDIATVASGNPDFSILVQALAKAELVDTLRTNGPFTVFAPTDAAFGKAGIDSNFIKEASKEDLAAILLYHVLVGSKLLKEDIASGITQTGSGNLLVHVKHHWYKGSTIILNEDVHVTATDVLASNGVIHVIDTVLQPPKNIVGVATDNADTFSTLLGYLTETDLVSTLSGNEPFTVFAPTNDAFAKLTVAPTMEELKNILLYHVVPGNVPRSSLPKGDVSTAFVKGGVVQTFDVDLWYSWWSSGVNVRGDTNLKKAKVVKFDVLAANGVIHAINGVLLPDLD